MANTSDLPLLAPASMRQRATDVLRAAIINGRLVPGDRLKEAELSEQLGISRAPVREALRQLEHEGLVVSLPYRATEVLGISQEEIAEVLVPIRLTLETFAFRRALPSCPGMTLTRSACWCRPCGRLGPSAILMRSPRLMCASTSWLSSAPGSSIVCRFGDPSNRGFGRTSDETPRSIHERMRLPTSMRSWSTF